MNVLVVDDEKLIRWSLRERLSRGGDRVIEAEDGRTAMAALDREVPDVVLLDMRLPDIDGLDVLKRVLARFPDLPVIIITAYSSVNGATEAMKLGACDYISKPFNLDELASAVRRSFASSRRKQGPPTEPES